VIVADDDGVVVVERDDVPAAVDGSKKRAENEEAKRQRLAAGELGLDIYRMRERLEREGLVYVDSLDDLP
jgi:4-hydroxy-4-methyl-2-oxoglutarate aldolase